MSMRPLKSRSEVFPELDNNSGNLRKRQRSVSPIELGNYENVKRSNRDEPDKAKERVESSNIYGKTGGAYIPPARLRQMQAQITDKSSEAYQRIAWEALKKSIHGFINKVNVSNISDVVRQLLCENIVRGRGLLVRSLITAQTTSPTFTHVFAALVAVVNSKFPQVGELVLKRLINEFRKAFRRNQKDRCLSTARFLAHLVNQKVVHELIVLELLTLLLEQTTDDSVEVAVSVLKECGAMLTRLVPKGVHGVFEHLRRILNEGNCDKRISYMLEVMFQIRRDGWKDHPIVLPDLDLIQEDDQITHTTSLLDQVDPEDKLNVFRFDPDYQANEEKYAQIKASFFESDDEDDAASDEDDEDGASGDDDDSDNADADQEDAERPQGAAAADGVDSKQTVIDQTETNLVHLRRTIYLMLQSSLSADEAGHRLLQLKIRPGEEYEVASMVLDCCAQTRSYETRYGRLAQRLCRVILTSGTGGGGGGSRPAAPELGPGSRYKPGKDYSAKKEAEPEPVVEDTGPPRSYVAEFEKIFTEQYSIIHRLETAKLRNVALFFAHLLYTDSISWGVLECVRLNERDTTSSGRIFLKHLFLELCSFMGLAKLHARLRDETLQPYFAGLLPRDNPKDTRFAINFLTTIGLGGLTLDLREHLQASREAALAKREAQAESKLSSDDEVDADDDESSSSSESSSTTSDSGSSSTSKSSESDEDRRGKGKKKKRIKDKRSKDTKKNSKKSSTKPAKDSESKELEKRLRAHSLHQKAPSGHIKERPIDTPFFNDTPNSPTRNVDAPLPHEVSPDRERKSRPDRRSSSRSPSPFSRGGMRSTVTMISESHSNRSKPRRNRSRSISSDKVRGSNRTESRVPRESGHHGSQTADASRRPSPPPSTDRRRRHDDRTPHPHADKYSTRNNSPKHRPDPTSRSPDFTSKSHDHHRSAETGHRKRSPHMSSSKPSDRSGTDRTRRTRHHSSDSSSSSSPRRSKSRSPFDRVRSKHRHSKPARSPRLSPHSRHPTVTAAQS